MSLRRLSAPCPQVDFSPNKTVCPPPKKKSGDTCRTCPSAWKAWPPVGSGQPGSKPRPSENNFGYPEEVVVLPLYFKEPVLLSAVTFIQIKKPGLRRVCAAGGAAWGAADRTTKRLVSAVLTSALDPDRNSAAPRPWPRRSS